MDEYPTVFVDVPLLTVEITSPCASTTITVEAVSWSSPMTVGLGELEAGDIILPLPVYYDAYSASVGEVGLCGSISEQSDMTQANADLSESDNIFELGLYGYGDGSGDDLITLTRGDGLIPDTYTWTLEFSLDDFPDVAPVVVEVLVLTTTNDCYSTSIVTPVLPYNGETLTYNLYSTAPI